MFSNIVVYSGGKGTSRGVGVRDGVCKDFGKSWFDRDIWQQTRMYYQLYLYFYELGKDKDYIPNLYKALRADPMVNHNSSTVSGQDSWLKFALKCCQIANADLSEFFESYGFFVPVSNRLVEDYSNSYVTMTERTAQQYREKMQAFEKKLGNLVFVEDRIYAAYGREPWGSPDKLRIDYSSEWPLGKMGDVGQYLDYEDETLVPSGYTYTRKGLKITINHAEGKGAVGFKVYNADGTLVAISNTYTFNLPQTMDGQKIKVVAAAPVGNNDAEILSSAIAGTEAEQLEALKSSLNTAKTYLAMTDSANAVVGWFVNSALEPLQAVYDQAKAAMDGADQTTHTYGEWSLVVDDAVYDLLQNAEARVALRPHNIYALYLSGYSNYCAANLSGGLKGNMLDPTTNLGKQWMFVPTVAEDTYYIQNVESGLYISYIASGKRIAVMRLKASGKGNINVVRSVKDANSRDYSAQASGIQYATEGISFSGKLDLLNYFFRLGVKPRGRKAKVEATEEGLRITGADELMIVMRGNTNFSERDNSYIYDASLLPDSIDGIVRHALAQPYKQGKSLSSINFRRDSGRVVSAIS